MFKQNISAREKRLLLISITLASIAIMYNVVIEPLIDYWKRLNTQIESKSTLLIKNTRLLHMYKTLEEEYAQYKGFIKESKNEEEELAITLGEIEKISEKSACYIVDVKPRPSKRIGNYKEVSLEITTDSSIDELSQFLYEVEKSPEYLRVTRFIIASKSGSQGRLKGTLLITKIIPFK